MSRQHNDLLTYRYDDPENFRNISRVTYADGDIQRSPRQESVLENNTSVSMQDAYLVFAAKCVEDLTEQIWLPNTPVLMLMEPWTTCNAV